MLPMALKHYIVESAKSDNYLKHASMLVLSPGPLQFLYLCYIEKDLGTKGTFTLFPACNLNWLP